MFYSEDLSLALFLEFFPNIKLLGSIFFFGSPIAASYPLWFPEFVCHEERFCPTQKNNTFTIKRN